MPVPANCYRVVLAGSLPGGEEWSTGFWVTGDAPTSNDDANSTADLWWDQLSANDVSGAMGTYLNFYCKANVVWRSTTVYSYPGGGSKAQYIGVHESNRAGTSQSPVLPNQVCVVASLRTGTAGRQNRGRMYLPANGIPLTADGQLAAADAQAIANTWATCFRDWDASGDNGTVVVVSQTATRASRVTAVVCDSRADIQRRRAASEAIDSRASVSL